MALFKPQEETLGDVLAELCGCRVCAAHLPLGPRPVIRGLPSARVLIISQAPSTRVHETGLSFNDRSGDRLRAWLGLDRKVFYDEHRIAIMPMGFCYPGRDAKGGDLPPRPECAPLWHRRVLAQWPAVELMLLVGSYAIGYYLPDRAVTMSETIKAWRDYPSNIIPLPHPSWRTIAWERKNPWFRRSLLPVLRRRVAALI